MKTLINGSIYDKNIVERIPKKIEDRYRKENKNIKFHLAKWHMERWCHYVSEVVGNKVTTDDVRELIHKEPEVKIKYEKRPKGEWLDFTDRHVELNEHGTPKGWAKCSICGKWLAGSGKIMATKGYFCPNCGAEMDGGE